MIPGRLLWGSEFSDEISEARRSVVQILLVCPEVFSAQMSYSVNSLKGPI